eukprot:COSAG04_NODE_2337_length_4306_cov_17.637271_3_plen_70_part_00
MTNVNGCALILCELVFVSLHLIISIGLVSSSHRTMKFASRDASAQPEDSADSELTHKSPAPGYSRSCCS